MISFKNDSEAGSPLSASTVAAARITSWLDGAN